jgi:hypothetical protein
MYEQFGFGFFLTLLLYRLWRVWPHFRGWLVGAVLVSFTILPFPLEALEANGRWVAPRHPLMRTALCMSGQTRTLNWAPSDDAYPTSWRDVIVQDARGNSIGPRPRSPKEDLHGMTVAESIRVNLYPILGDVDVFVAIATKGAAREPAAGDSRVCDSLRPTTPDAFVSCDIWMEFDLPLFSESPIWNGYYLKNYKQGFLQQLYGMWRCHEAIKRREIETGVRYSHVVRIRPDVAIPARANVSHISDLDFGSHDAPIVLMADKKQCCCGNEDWFNVGERGPMELFLERFVYLQASAPVPATLGPFWDAEIYAAAVLVRYMWALSLRRLHRPPFGKHLPLTNYQTMCRTKLAES